MRRRVRFNASCDYTLPGIDTLDCNKLLGRSYGTKGPHWNSVRFGFRPDPTNAHNDIKRTQIVAYCYVEGVRQWVKAEWPMLYSASNGAFLDLEIVDDGSQWILSVYTTHGRLIASHAVAHGPLPKYGMTCGLYFGGDATLDHALDLDIS